MKRKTKTIIVVVGVLMVLVVFSFLFLNGVPDKASKRVSAETHATRGEELYHSARYEEALEEYKIAVELDPNNLDYHTGLAAAYERCGMIEEAIKELEAYIHLSKDEEANKEVRKTINLLEQYLKSLNKVE
jgi:tetratricopeptide (TPR) repeat protein